MIGLLLHLENVSSGITPSMLESVRHYAKSFGVTHIHVVDATQDGYFDGIGDEEVGYQRWATFADWRDEVSTPGMTLVGIETQNTIEAHDGTATNIMQFQHPADNAWYAFGPSTGFDGDAITVDLDWVYLPTLVPIGGFSSREALTLVLAHRFFINILGG
jgi:hypothetical protein